MHTKERQIGRIQEDIAKLKDEKEDVGRQLVEVSQTKDEGWKKLNEQLGEIEHLREVINEQERMLEERRVGLISQEEVIKELRDAREKQIQDRCPGQGRARRAPGRSAPPAGPAPDRGRGEQAPEPAAHRVPVRWSVATAPSDLTNELLEARIEVKKIEADRDRFQEQLRAAKREVQALEERVTQLDVDLQRGQARKLDHGRPARRT